MEKIRVRSENEYIIEVNDNGDTISFDLTDPTLPFRVNRAFNECKRLVNDLNKKENKIKMQKDKKRNAFLLSANEYELARCYTETYENMREIMDELLGLGACQKIFGDRNWLTMYNDLFEMLEPHFEKMNIKLKAVKEKIIEKYSNTNTGDIL